MFDKWMHLYDLHVGFLVLVVVEAFGEDEVGYGSFFGHQSVGHTFLLTWGV